MIVGSISQWETQRQRMHPVLRKAIDYLAQQDMGTLEEGVYPVWGGELSARVMRYETKLKSEQPAEKHERYLDIHYVIEGEEIIGWKQDDGLNEPTQPYDAVNDFALYGDLQGERMMTLKPGMYMVLFPDDIHRPGLTESAVSKVRKVVMKVHVGLF
ncbi:conserved hypothetical protein [Paenibacillus curdlanolyticus YK9]|uniref:YhcH/YjgK/YiaL family protein n=2 Tax=Paenibacillus curdlanolyticus TaxID=59840 RepID=E0IEZ2_9BACL|nr:conserved hypothetical protein [Paenibacillus curdlanolyticus YK9]